MNGYGQIRRSVPGGVRLTRRGRAVLVCAMMSAILAVLWVGARHGAHATSSGGRPSATALESVVVRSHDTLWGIAVRTRPGVDPRITVPRMIDLNTLSGAIVNPGQRVLLPSR